MLLLANSGEIGTRNLYSANAGTSFCDSGSLESNFLKYSKNDPQNILWNIVCNVFS